MIGKYGEVLILDWGIANFINSTKDLNKEKIVGTLAYMAPERASGKPATIQTDIYALGVILYQILTLSAPFNRQNINVFKKLIPYEKLISPIEKAPFRDIPMHLNTITQKCLDANTANRYQNVKEIINDVKSYMEGKPNWILRAKLHQQNKDDWEFQENIFLTKNIAITQNFDIAEWASLMVSKKNFVGNIKINVDICLKKDKDQTSSKGIGFLLTIS